VTSRYIVRENEDPCRFAELKAAVEAAGGAVGPHGIHVEEWWTTDGLHADGSPVFVYHYAIQADPRDAATTITVHSPEGSSA